STPGLQPESGVGVITADGAGHFVAGTETFNTRSQGCTKMALSGTDKVNPHRTGTTRITFTGQHAGCSGSFTQSLVIFQGVLGKGNLIKLIGTDPGFVTLSEEWQKQAD